MNGTESTLESFFSETSIALKTAGFVNLEEYRVGLIWEDDGGKITGTLRDSEGNRNRDLGSFKLDWVYVA